MMETISNPYRPPEPEVVPPNPFREFDTAFLPSWLLIGIAPMFATVPMAIDSFHGLPPVSVALAAGAVTLMGAAFANIILIRYFKVHVSSDGLKCFDFWGRYDFVEWHEINQAKPINVVGLRYLRIFANTLKRPIWLPLFLKDPGQFRKSVLASVEVDSPLGLAIAKALPDRSSQ